MRLARQDCEIPRLLLINGPPGVGKSTVARRYLDDHPLALLIEIDVLRVAMGGWSQHEESKLLARGLAIAMARAHLGAGHDVVVPQYLGRTEFIEALEATASQVTAEFRHVVLMDEPRSIVDRFLQRRQDLTDEGLAHPEADLADAEVDAAVAGAITRLEQIAAARADTNIVSMSGPAADPYPAVLSALEKTRP